MALFFHFYPLQLPYRLSFYPTFLASCFSPVRSFHPSAPLSLLSSRFPRYRFSTLQAQLLNIDRVPLP